MTAGVPTIPLQQQRSAEAWAAMGVVCPTCHSTLSDVDDLLTLACTGCAARFPVTCGIPDLRTGADPYLTRAEDADAAVQLALRDVALSFAALYASYYEGNTKVPPEQVAQFTRGVLAASDRAVATLGTWRELGAPIERGGLVVELGCGTAPLGTHLASSGHRVLGIDAGLRWLTLARKRAAERGVDLPVVCANAEQLPLGDGCATLVVGESVLENLADPVAGIAEAHRVTVADGWLALSTPNRHSLGPDPHLGVMAGGWRSEGALRAYARRTGKVFPRRRLFSSRELIRTLVQGGYADVRLALPRFADAQRAGLPLPLNLAVAGYHFARRVPALRSLVLAVGPTLVCLARRA